MANKNPETKQLMKPGTYKFTDEDREKARASRLHNLSKRKTFREVFDALLSQEYTAEDGSKVTGVEMAAMKVIEQIMVNGNMEAFKIARDTVGEKPVEKIMVADVDPDIIADVERAVLADEDDTATGVGLSDQ